MCPVAEAVQGAEPVFVQGSPEAVARVLAPVLENACAYARGQVRVTASAEPSPGVLVVDDGPGVAASEVDAVFDPGVRGSAPRSPSAPPGTGLGLPLARRLARALGGEVTVADGGGGRFLVSFRRLPSSGTERQ